MIGKQGATERRRMAALEQNMETGNGDADVRSVAATLGIPFVSDMNEIALDSARISELPVEWARSRAVLPVRYEGRDCVLMANPRDFEALEDLRLLLGMALEPVAADAETVTRCIERCYFDRKDGADAYLQELSGKPGQETTASVVVGGEDLLRDAQEAPVTQLMNLILLDAVRQRASDIHIEPCEQRIRLRYRIDGLLYERNPPPKSMGNPLISRLKVMAHLDLGEHRLPQDGMARVTIGERAIDIRVSTVPVTDGERVVLRLLDRGTVLPSLEELGLPRKIVHDLSGVLEEANGLLAVSGPTGSGKTTTLYALMARLDRLHKNVMTIEDPVEYRLADIAQIQVKPAIGLTFARGLRHVLRQDPDVVLVGETRDTETAQIAVRSALTGHLVLTTLHTNDAPGALVRLVDMGIEPYLLASALRAVVSQRLVRRLCLHCRKPAQTPFDMSFLGAKAQRILDGVRPWEPHGCPECMGGYRGRIGLFEFMRMDDTVRDAVRGQNVDLRHMRELAAHGGMTTLNEDAAAKIAAGETDPAEVLRVTGRAEEDAP